jgi:hypothetical protein
MTAQPLFNGDIQLLTNKYLKFCLARPDAGASDDADGSGEPSVEWTSNPLECLQCARALHKPYTMSSCCHVFCRECVFDGVGHGQSTIVCPLCGRTNDLSPTVEDSSVGDALVNYLIESTNAPTECCANCEQVCASHSHDGYTFRRHNLCTTARSASRHCAQRAVSLHTRRACSVRIV